MQIFTEWHHKWSEDEEEEEQEEVVGGWVWWVGLVGGSGELSDPRLPFRVNTS